MPTSMIPIPIVVSIMVLLLYVMIGAFLFKNWEGWDLTTSLYFSFITLTTIGFGDYSPEQSFVGIDQPGAGFNEYFKMIFTTTYCAIGKYIIYCCFFRIKIIAFYWKSLHTQTQLLGSWLPNIWDNGLR